MGNALTRIYVTRYALTTDIEVADAKISFGGKMATYKSGRDTIHVHGKDFHLTREAAFADAERRRKAKLASIEKQAAKLRALKFTIPEDASHD